MHPIQTGVHYCPGLKFAAFDVAWSRDAGVCHKGTRASLEHDGWGCHRMCVTLSCLHAEYLDLHVARALLTDAGILAVPVLAQGLRLESALAFPVEFSTHVPGMLGLPALQKEHCKGKAAEARGAIVNQAEGIVVRAEQESLFACDLKCGRGGTLGLLDRGVGTSLTDVLSQGDPLLN